MGVDLRTTFVAFVIIALPTIGFAYAEASVQDTPSPTQVVFSEILRDFDLSDVRPWRPPDFSGQEEALGYGPGAFAVPTGMEDRVSFWIDIYTKYTTDQGVLHDSQYVNLVYESVDFSDIMQDKSLNANQKARARRQRLEQARKTVSERLQRLQQIDSPVGLEGDDHRYWYMFSGIDDKNKFKAASQPGRLRFQLGQRDRFIQGIFQSGRYIEEMEQIFRLESIPIELIRLVFVESSFNLRARSRVGASGLWQFMRGTARQYMRMDASVDERNDPLVSTRSAARKLRDNYRMLETWPLAVTGYNHGPYGMRRMVNQMGTTDIVELTDVRRGRFRFASANFYASFLAALEVEREASKYFGEPLYWMPALRGEEIRLDKAIAASSIISWFDEDEAKARDLNPHILNHIWRGRGVVGAGHFVRVPSDKLEQARESLENKEPAKMQGREYKVTSGETLSEIAQRFGVSVSDLLKANGISDPRSLRAGQTLFIP